MLSSSVFDALPPPSKGLGLMGASSPSRTREERFRALVGQAPMQYLSRWRIQLAVRRLEQSRVKIGALALELGYESEAAFSRAFKQATGMSPLEYVHTIRLEEAKQMLEAGDEPVEAVANAVGYEDSGFFGRLFKKKVGLTPAQYRKRFGSLRDALRAGT